MQSTLNESDTASWEQISPLLDEAMGRLGETDRNAIILRFFENKTPQEVATTLKMNEVTARKRVSRSLEKLRRFFTKRGVTLSAAVLTAAISTNSVQAAPVGLVATVAAAAKGTVATSVAVLAKSTMKTMTWLKAKFALTVGVSILAAGGIAVVVADSMNEPPTNPTLARQMIQSVFSHVSSPLPAQMRFVAEVKDVSKPWTEAQISAEVQREEEAEHKSYQNIVGLRDEDIAKLPKAAKERRAREQADLREVRLESTRTYHSGTRTFSVQEWLAGGLWRLDQSETTPKPEKIQAMDKPLPDGTVYERSMFNFSETNFTGQPLSQIDNRLRSAWFGNVNWEKDSLWEAATLEPDIGFLLTFAAGDFMDFARQAQAKSHDSIDSFAGVKLDTGKLEALASGKDGRWIVKTDEAVLNGRKMAVLRLKGKTVSLAHGEEVAFFADAEHLTNIYRIELTGMPLVKTPYISIRDDFDTNGFPHTWIVETPDDDALTKAVKFKEVDFHASFDNKTVFSPEIPAGYQINGRLPK